MTIQQRRRGSHLAPQGRRPQAGPIDERTQLEPVFLTVQEVADLLRVSAGTVRAWVAKGEGPPAMRFGKQIRYRPERVMEWVREQEGGAR